MANEIKRTTTLNWTKRGASIAISVNETIDQTGNNAIENVQIIGATSEAITLGDVSGEIHLAFKNLNEPWSELTQAEKDAVAGSTTAEKKAAYELANTVHVGTSNPVTSGNAEFAFVPGSGTSFKTSITAWFGIRQTNDVDLLVVAIEV
jgi:Holliday junction resolvasome RuvABC endonuclease subunit